MIQVVKQVRNVLCVWNDRLIVPSTRAGTCACATNVLSTSSTTRLVCVQSAGNPYVTSSRYFDPDFGLCNSPEVCFIGPARKTVKFKLGSSDLDRSEI